jgi:hypothetical protein
MLKASLRTTTLAFALAWAPTLGCANDEGSSGGGLSVAGTYDTAVSLISSNCPFTVQSNPTQVRSTGPTTITLTHAGTTYSGIIEPDSSFVTQQKVVTVGGTSYRITIAGDFTPAGLDAQVTVVFGSTPCTAIVRWLGPRS